jgi:hypothetical protein
MSTYEQEELWRSAKAFAGDKLFNEIFERLTEKYIQTWATSDPGDAVVRDDAYHMVRAVASLRTELTALAAEPDVVKFNSRLKRS